MTKPFSSMRAEQLNALVGSKLGVSEWVPIDQSRIDDFARVTDDHQFIHVDPQRAAAESPFNGTIAHGFLTLALLPSMVRDALPQLQGVRARLNYGFNKVRFLAPVPSGARIRASFSLLSVEERRPKELTIRYEVIVEIEGNDKPALAAEWLSRILLVEED